MTTQIERHTEAELEREIIIAQVKIDEKKIDLGVLGRFFGANQHLPVYVAALVVMMGMAFIPLVIFALDVEFDDRMKVIALLGSLVSGALGFIFGVRHSS